MQQHHHNQHNRWSGQTMDVRSGKHQQRRSAVSSTQQVQPRNYDSYDVYERYSSEEYGNGEYDNGDMKQSERRSWEQQPTDLYENVPNSRNVARIEIHAEDQRSKRGDTFEEEQLPAVRVRQREERRGPRQPHTRERDDRRALSQSDEERHHEERRGSRQAERLNVDRRDSRDGAQSRQKDQSRREPHLRFEPSPVPYAHKQGYIDGFGQPVNHGRSQNPNDARDERGQQRNREANKENGRNGRNIPQAPPAPTSSIRAIINNLKGNSSQNKTQGEEEKKNVPKMKVTTNPFLRNGEKQSSTPQNIRDEPVKNVQEVVQKMNSGEWPIRIEDESPNSRPPSQQMSSRTKTQDKAKEWETLDRRSPTKSVQERKKREQRGDFESDRAHREVQPRPQGKGNDSDQYSETAEQTTVSTDSAMGSDENTLDTHQMHLPFELPQGTILRKLPPNIRELNDEGERLLIYLKGHRPVLNYLGIGLSETLWNHIHSLPTCHTEITIRNETQQTTNGKGNGRMNNPHINVSPPDSSTRNEKSPRSKSPRHRMNQSPRLTAIERELCTDLIEEEEVHPNEHRNGRFVKKSAAALIAKKQGTFTSLPVEEVPASTDFADPRIAAEIQQLQQREDELKKSRTALGLPSIEDVMDTWSGMSPLKPGRSSQQLDYMKQMPAPITKSQSAHNIYIDGDFESGDGYWEEEYDNSADYNQQRNPPRKVNNGNHSSTAARNFDGLEREDQFFRDSPSSRFRDSRPNTNKRTQCVVKGVDIAVHSGARRASANAPLNRKIGL